jgi:hypothetical protein
MFEGKEIVVVRVDLEMHVDATTLSRVIYHVLKVTSPSLNSKGEVTFKT